MIVISTNHTLEKDKIKEDAIRAEVNCMNQDGALLFIPQMTDFSCLTVKNDYVKILKRMIIRYFLSNRIK